ncbi:YbaB/EbfC family nucleoid-associated protein [Microbacterium sp. GXF7504]
MDTAGELLTAIGAQLQRAVALSDAVTELGAQFANLRGIGRTDDGEATVTVDQHGIVLDVRLSDDVVDHTGEEIAGFVLEATRRAIADVQEQGEPLRAAVLQPHVTSFDTTLGDRLDALYDRVAGAVRDLDTDDGDPGDRRPDGQEDR